MDARYALSRNEEENLLKEMKAESLRVCEIPVSGSSSPRAFNLPELTLTSLLRSSLCRLRRRTNGLGRVGLPQAVQGDEGVHGYSVRSGVRSWRSKGTELMLLLSG